MKTKNYEALHFAIFSSLLSFFPVTKSLKPHHILQILQPIFYPQRDSPSFTTTITITIIIIIIITITTTIGKITVPYTLIFIYADTNTETQLWTK